MPPRPHMSLDEQFPLKPLELHHDLATWHRRSEEALLRHYSDAGHIDRLRSLMGLPPLQRVSVTRAPAQHGPGPGAGLADPAQTANPQAWAQMMARQGGIPPMPNPGPGAGLADPANRTTSAAWTQMMANAGAPGVTPADPEAEADKALQRLYEMEGNVRYSVTGNAASRRGGGK